jgi:phosphotransferase system enzyme I (PtsI)
LGVRGIRIYNIAPDLFINQIKAILMLPLQKIKILVPMVSSAEEIISLKKLCIDLFNDIKKVRMNSNVRFQIGAMLEVPSAILAIDEFKDEVDFFSIGTNDLIQYTLAIDRTNNDVAYLYQPLHKSILKLIQIAVEFCQKNNKELTVCGEIANDPVYASLLVGMGIKGLSIAPSSIPNIKKTICGIKYEQVKQLVKKVLQFENPQEAYTFLQEQLGFHTTKPQ